MPDAISIERFSGRLAELGCTARQIRKRARELADHREDLRNAALEEGLAESAAEARADERLGEPVALAEYVAAVLRQSSWWGRHPIIGFCLLPPFVFVVVWGICLAIGAAASRLLFDSAELHALQADRIGAGLFQSGLAFTFYAALVLTSISFCWLSRHTACGLRWAVAACGACAIHAYFCFFRIEPGYLAVGYYWQRRVQDLTGVWVPLLVAVAALFWQWRLRIRVTPSLRTGRMDVRAFYRAAPEPAGNGKLLKLPESRWVTPSSVIAAVLMSVIVALALFGWRAYSQDIKTRKRLESEVWPRERAAVEEQIRARQRVAVAANARPIDLRLQVNAGIREAIGVEPENNLAELPGGRYEFGGIPFELQGRIELMNRRLGESARAFPARIKNIEVGQKFVHLHLLHGAHHLSAQMRGTTIARIRLRYTDGSRHEFPIVAGEQVLDWWGIVCPAGNSDRTNVPEDPGTELAWVGSNPAIAKQRPEACLRLYRTTFANPHPEREVVAVDYESSVTDAGPFLLGLTVE